jgi:hypothetical protein
MSIYKRIIVVILLLNLSNIVNISAQKYDGIIQMLDTIQMLNNDLSPNQAKEYNKIGARVIWAGLIDTVNIWSSEKGTTISFYCNHLYFKKFSEEMLSKNKIKLKKNGDGKFSTSITSAKMTIESAIERIDGLLDYGSQYIVVIGEIELFEKAFHDEYVYVKSYYFITIPANNN